MNNELNRPLPPDVVEEMDDKCKNYEGGPVNCFREGYIEGYNRCDFSLERAQNQRFIALKNAFETIRAFAEPSLDPDQFEHFEELERILIERYSVSV